MGIERSYGEPSQFRRVMLTKIGEGIKDYYAIPKEPLAPNLVELLRRLDDRATDSRGSGHVSPRSANTK